MKFRHLVLFTALSFGANHAFSAITYLYGAQVSTGAGAGTQDGCLCWGLIIGDAVVGASSYGYDGTATANAMSSSTGSSAQANTTGYGAVAYANITQAMTISNETSQTQQYRINYHIPSVGLGISNYLGLEDVGVRYTGFVSNPGVGAAWLDSYSIGYNAFDGTVLKDYRSNSVVPREISGQTVVADTVDDFLYAVDGYFFTSISAGISKTFTEYLTVQLPYFAAVGFGRINQWEGPLLSATVLPSAVESVPEPTSLVLFGAGLLALVGTRSKNRIV